ncbi:MAG: DEAD/DEAH box helicase [Desulfurococcales archaeon]|nr:DEAD/DEAH box helicase [Desulfurococcales archaeon]
MGTGEESGNIAGLLHPAVREMAIERWGSLNPVQRKAIPLILAGRNVLIVAPTGEGKTEAALLPVLSLMVSSRPKPVSLLYITPMKALINDIYERIKWWADRLGFIVSKKHGDVSIRERSRRLRKVPHILVTTPESLKIDLDWAPRFRGYYRNLKWVIVDEVHEIYSSKRGSQLAILLERLSHMAGRDLQRIGLSATLGDPEKASVLLFGSSKRDRAIVSVGSDKRALIKVVYVEETRDAWSKVGRILLEEIEKPSLVFVNSRYTAEKLKEALETERDTRVFVHHSSVSAEIREEAEKRLKEGLLSAIVCTKTLEVGIDVGRIRKVIQIRAPGRVSSLIQRIGRSGHVLGGVPRGTIISVGMADFIEALAEANLAAKGYIEESIIPRIHMDAVARELQGILLERGEVSIEEAYEILSRAVPDYLSYDYFKELVDYLAKTGVLVVSKEGKLKLGKTFYKLWRFPKSGADRAKAWWAKEFPEFFTLIPDKDYYMVKHGDRVVGLLDSTFVYRHVRVGDSIRLAGATWEVVGIDESMMKVEVKPSSSEAEIPFWRGEGPRRSREVAIEFYNIIKGSSSILVEASEEGIERIRKIAKSYERMRLPIPSETTIIYENVNGEHVFTGPLGSGVAETLGLVLTYIAMKKRGLDVYYRPAFFGFSVYAPEIDILKALKELDPTDFYELLEKAIMRSPQARQVIREIQASFGKIGYPDPEDDRIIWEEAIRQVAENYMDIKGAISLLEAIRNGEVRIIENRSGKPSPLGLEVLRQPLVRPWIDDVGYRIARTLEGAAFTVTELSDILDMPEKTILAKLKELRKPEHGKLRVVGFIDVDEMEWRWSLAEELPEIATSEEFSNSFSPTDMQEPLRLTFKAGKTSGVRELIVTPALVSTEWARVRERLPDELYMVKVSSAYFGASREESVVFYHVSADNLKYLILNAAAVIQARSWIA